MDEFQPDFIDHPLKKKHIHFLVPMSLYESFYRLFPGRGERSACMRHMLYTLIRLKEKDEPAMNELEKEIRRRYGKAE